MARISHLDLAQLILNRAQGFANNVYYIEASSHAEIAEYRKSSDDDGAQFACFRFAAKRHALPRTRVCTTPIYAQLDPVKLISLLFWNEMIL